jgi:hypothetical protein
MEYRKAKQTAIEKFVQRFKGSFKKIGPNDVDYRVFDTQNNLIAYAEIEITNKTLDDCYPLEIKASSVVKVCNKRLNPVLIWGCKDGLVYGKPHEIIGEVSWKYDELILTFPKQKTLRYIKYY